MDRYPTHLGALSATLANEDACIELMARIRWPNGFRCPHCHARDACRLRLRPIWKCRGCRRQTRLTANTALHRTRVSMGRWLQAIFTFAKKSGISALQLAKDLGVAETTAMFMLRRIRAFLDEPDRRRLFRGNVEMGLLPLIQRDARAKPVVIDEQHRRHQDLVVVVERLEATRTIDPITREKGRKRWTFGRIRIGALPRGLDPARFAAEHVAPKHLPLALTSFPITQTLLGNARDLVRGTFHGVSRKHLAGYLRAFAYRFNRRDLEPMLPVLMMRRLLRGKPTTRDALADTAPSLAIPLADVPPVDARTFGAPPPQQPPAPPPAIAAAAPADDLDAFFALIAGPVGSHRDDEARAALAAMRARSPDARGGPPEAP